MTSNPFSPRLTSPREFIRPAAVPGSHSAACTAICADHGISNASDVFLAAARLRLKGVTIYRYGSRPRQVLSLSEPEISECRECGV
jgi:hypothetical protein